MWAIKLESIELCGHLVAPAAMAHELALEVQFEEELVYQMGNLGIPGHLHGDGDLDLGSVNVEFEGNEILFPGDTLHYAQRSVLFFDPRRNRRIKKMINLQQAFGDVVPKALRFQ